MPEPSKKEPPATPPSIFPEVAALVQQVAELSARLAVAERVMSVERPVALPMKLAQEREEEFERMKAELSKPPLQRTQEAAERLWGKDTKDRYSVVVPGHLSLLIPARSEEEAKGRYDKISGITSIDSDRPRHQIKIVSNAV